MSTPRPPPSTVTVAAPPRRLCSSTANECIGRHRPTCYDAQDLLWAFTSDHTQGTRSSTGPPRVRGYYYKRRTVLECIDKAKITFFFTAKGTIYPDCDESWMQDSRLAIRNLLTDCEPGGGRASSSQIPSSVSPASSHLGPPSVDTACFQKSPTPETPAVVKRRTNVAVNRITTLEVLYEYPVGYTLEYPETSSTGSIGHLFHIDPDNWEDSNLEYAYSRGGRMGRSVLGATVKCLLLVDAEGIAVDCSERHTTCEGSKICPNSNTEELSVLHTKASREDVRDRLKKDRDDRLQYVSPTRDIFLKTSSFLAALQKLGCGRPLFEITTLSATEEEEREAKELYTYQVKGASTMVHIILNILKPLYRAMKGKPHRLKRLFLSFGYGPLADCSTVANCSQQKAYCPFPHRDETQNLTQPLMKRLGCSSKFRVFEPKEEFRTACPMVLIVTNTAKLMEILGKLAEDLPDITPRKFIRHPLVQSFLRSKYPLVVCPTLADWHVSLSNRSHINSYIKLGNPEHCPFGTGWSGVVNLKAQQDVRLPPADRYIRRIIALPAKDSIEGSRRLLAAGRYVQSDIAFRRIMGVLGNANTSLIFCRVYINRQSAAAHQRVFEEIESIVKEDTGESLKWRHLHASSAEGPDGYGNFILSWTADQHRGQAKGLGLHLQKLASNMATKVDLHEPHRTIQDLDPYDHLRRLFRICTVHNSRNINKCSHEDWEGTLLKIRQNGGKAGNDWVNDKESSKFFFPGICWERSLIPLDVWNAGDANSNLIESVHRDVNREGVHCTLLGGLKKGQLFDAVKMKTLKTFESYGITPSFKTGHRSENAYHNLKRNVSLPNTYRSEFSASHLAGEDQKIERHNEKLLKSLETLVKGSELHKKRKTQERAMTTFEKQKTEKASLKTGSGKVKLSEIEVRRGRWGGQQRPEQRR
ncbi:hypothetical protein R3P38DRAFT_3321572 [Favolaschia claudopus]|uniref:Uncharacterized protein n=1 Tax=Favolaschia claudopus TaxID=2862362 RepID=A0AAW0AR66_9AGAR